MSGVLWSQGQVKSTGKRIAAFRETRVRQLMMSTNQLRFQAASPSNAVVRSAQPTSAGIHHHEVPY